MALEEINQLNTLQKQNAQHPVYTVKKGDTLYSVAKSLGVSVDTLVKFNKLKSTNLSVGQVINIPPKKENQQIFHPAKNNDKGFSLYREISDKELQNNPFIKTIKHSPHTIIKGDTPSTLARQYNVLQSSILMENNMEDGDILTIGEKIKIPPTLKAQNVKNIRDAARATGLSQDYINNLIDFEEVHKTAYTDKNGNKTIGVGHKITKEEESKYNNKTLSDEEIYTLLAQDLINRQENIKSIIGLTAYQKMPQPIKDAVTDFVFSRGESSFTAQKELVRALETGDYKTAISKMNVDYSVLKFKTAEETQAFLAQHDNSKLFVVSSNRKEVKKFMSGLSKRRLYEMAHASKIYKGNLPSEVISSAQKMYNRGLYFLNLEAEIDSGTKKALPNIKLEYNELVQKWFNGQIKQK